ncbi:hypothetical protein QJR26_18735 (plasmid) [Clostridium baratii]
MSKEKILEFLKKNKVGIGITGTIVAVGLISAIGYGVHKNKVKDNEHINIAAGSQENMKSDNVINSNKEKIINEKKEAKNNGQAKEDISSNSQKVEEKNNNYKNTIKTDLVSNNDSNKNTVKKTENKKEPSKSSNINNKKEPSKPLNINNKKPVNKKPVVEVQQTGLAGKIASTKTAKKTNQIILVNGRSVSLWNKNNGKWNKSLEAGARIGYNGFTSAGNKREGDGATPTGSYPILYGFGFGANPGTSLGYKKITQNSYFVDDPKSKYYNQWYEGTGQKGEHMIEHPQYKYGMVIGYNTSHTPGKGSAIFLHANGKGNTAGCISIPESSMLSLLKATRPGAYVIITSSEDNLKYY